MFDTYTMRNGQKRALERCGHTQTFGLSPWTGRTIHPTRSFSILRTYLLRYGITRRGQDASWCCRAGPRGPRGFVGDGAPCGGWTTRWAGQASTLPRLEGSAVHGAELPGGVYVRGAGTPCVQRSHAGFVHGRRPGAESVRSERAGVCRVCALPERAGVAGLRACRWFDAGSFDAGAFDAGAFDAESCSGGDGEAAEDGGGLRGRGSAAGQVAGAQHSVREPGVPDVDVEDSGCSDFEGVDACVVVAGWRR